MVKSESFIGSYPVPIATPGEYVPVGLTAAARLKDGQDHWYNDPTKGAARRLVRDNIAAKKAQDLASEYAAQAANELANRETMTEEHAKWLVDPSCALRPYDDPLSCSHMAPFVVGTGDAVRYVVNDATKGILRDFYSDIAAQKNELNQVKTDINTIMHNVGQQVYNQDPGIGQSEYLESAFNKDKERYDREFDGKLWVEGTDMDATKKSIKQAKTMSLVTDIALGFVPILGEVMLGEVLGDLACNEVSSAAHGAIDDACAGMDSLVAHTTAGGLTDIGLSYEEDHYSHTVGLESYYATAALRNTDRLAKAIATNNPNTKENIMSSYEFEKSSQYVKLTQLWNAWDPTKWSVTNPVRKQLIDGHNKRVWGSDTSGEVANLQSFIATGSMKGCDPLTDQKCRAAIFQWCEKHPEFQWMCDAKPSTMSHEQWMKDQWHASGETSWFPYDDFATPSGSDYFTLEPVIEDTANHILGLE